MVHLAAPPRFALPPPPMPPSEIFDANLLSQLTCSSIRQQQASNPRLILISSMFFVAFALMLTLVIILIQIFRQRKHISSSNSSKSTSISQTMTSSERSISTFQSYETISSRYTGYYLESVNTSATTCSTDRSQTICLHCQQDRQPSSISPPPFYHTLDILPS